MSILIVHHNPLTPSPYDRWLAGYDGDIVLLTARDRIELAGEQVPTGNLGYTELVVLEKFDDAMIDHAVELAQRHRTTRLIAHFEGDVDRAARLRRRLDLPGAWPADVLPFRDKLLMKRPAQRAGIEVASHTLARTPAHMRRFAEQHGHPLVFKDRAGYNSIGLRILHDRQKLEDCLVRSYTGEVREDVLVEAFVPGRMCHVDGLVVNGRTVLAWPSQYQYDLASFGTDTGPRVDLALDQDDPLTGRLLELTDRILAALTPADTRLREHAFHAEIFHTPDDRLVLCEIACRPGGGKIREVLHAMFGINLGECTTHARAGLPLPALDPAFGGTQHARDQRRCPVRC